jgi:hypothetical protein
MPENKGSKDAVTGERKYKRDPLMNTRGSKFVKFQEARIQEMSDEVGGCRANVAAAGPPLLGGGRVAARGGWAAALAAAVGMGWDGRQGWSSRLRALAGWVQGAARPATARMAARGVYAASLRWVRVQVQVQVWAQRWLGWAGGLRPVQPSPLLAPTTPARPPRQVPEGCTPRTMSIHIKGPITRRAKAGDIVELGERRRNTPRLRKRPPSRAAQHGAAPPRTAQRSARRRPPAAARACRGRPCRRTGPPRRPAP